MNAANFAEEFTQLILRWTKPEEKGDGPPLTNQQILNVIRDVVQVLLGVSIEVPDYSSVRTPATGISVCTPNAPTIPKLQVDTIASLGRFRSLDTLTTSNVNISNNETPSSKSQEKMDIVKGYPIESTSEQMKFISRSSPAIHANSVQRSDTFVRDEEDKNELSDVMNKNERCDEEKNQISDLDLQKMRSNSFRKKIESLQQCAFDVISQIEQIRKEMYPETVKPIRRLSLLGGFPGLSRTSSLMRPIQPPKLRRSSSGIPGTPTSSKLNTTITASKEEHSAKRKNVAVSKISPTNRTPSLALSSDKKSPLSGGRPAKNPKYAHVQSTIPKPMVAKRRAQS